MPGTAGRLVGVCRKAEVGIVTVDHPPVNALNHRRRLELLAAIRELIAGADIQEFAQAPQAPYLPQITDAVADLAGLDIGCCAFARERIRAVDIDMVWIHGYGFPPWRGGPMFHADQIGTARVLESIERLRDRLGSDFWTPAPGLSRAAAQ